MFGSWCLLRNLLRQCHGRDVSEDAQEAIVYNIAEDKCSISSFVDAKRRLSGSTMRSEDQRAKKGEMRASLGGLHIFGRINDPNVRKLVNDGVVQLLMACYALK